MKTLAEYPDVLDARMIAEYLSIGYVKALNLIKYGDIPHIKIGNTYRVSKSVFFNWVNSTESKAVSF